MGKRKRRSFSKEYKAEVVALIRKSGKGIGAVARDLGPLGNRCPPLDQPGRDRFGRRAVGGVDDRGA